MTFKPMFQWRQQYDTSKEEYEARSASDVRCDDASRTVQAGRDDADINVLVERFGVAGRDLPPEAVDPRYYGDFSDVPDLRTALDRVRDAEERFSELPVGLRNRFDNDPSLLWSFVMDPANADEAVKLGLLRAPAPVEEVTSSPPSSPPATVPPAGS